MWLYKMTNRLNGKAYIGTSVNPISHRISRHLYAAKHGCTNMAISCAIRKYGLAGFAVECIGESQDYEELLRMEARAIQEQKTLRPNGYNVTSGGCGARRACSQETRSLISAKTKGRIPWNLGKRNEQTIKRYAGKGNLVRQPDGRKPWNFGMKFGPMPEEFRQRIAEGVRQVRATRFWSSKKNSISGGN